MIDLWKINTNAVQIAGVLTVSYLRYNRRFTGVGQGDITRIYKR